MNTLKNNIFTKVKDELGSIENALRQNLASELGIVSQIASHILFSGGKRLRPLLMVLCARLCGYRGAYDIIFSTVFEYLHVATLLHDDLVDDAALRRGRPVAHSIWGNSVAVLVGDFLLARSLCIGCKTGSMKVIRVIAEITENMSQGEIQQLTKKEKLDLSEEEYTEVIERKTAVLIEGACRVGAIIADAQEQEETALSTYGLNLGIAFQMADDLLDYISDTSSLGKETGADLREGKLTLPVIFALKQAGSEDRTWMESIIKSKSFSDEEFERLTGMLKKYGGIEHTEKMAKEYIKKAKDALSVFTNSDHSETKETLLAIADYVLEREN
ncbi:MAG: polyprenyl synthetase family protein [Desulfobacteraceae bacterium]|nr:polyprenyl synthetase family protein [Desulfobacteraceae bacterium]